MNADVKKKWLEALRSGAYVQGSNYLRNADNTFCCLGVLCDLAAREGLGMWSDETLGGTAGSYYAFSDATTSHPPKLIRDQAEIDVSPYVSKGLLTNLNDSGDYDFNAIADLIERDL